MDVFKDLVWDNLILAAKVELFAAFPFLAVPPISWAVSYIIDRLSGILYTAMKEFVNVEMIILRNEAAKAAFTRSSVTLKIIALNKGIESKEYKDARAENVTYMQDFVRRRRSAA